MLTVQNTLTPLIQEKPSLISFEDSFKGAYSHGLERIYTLEHVNLKTVRKIDYSPIVLSKSIAEEEYEEIQLQLDLGPFYRQWMTPFVLEEPIQVLNLAKQPEKYLKDHSLTQLKHLFLADQKTLISFQGLGQGHIDTISESLKKYLIGKAIQKSQLVDFLSFIKCLFADLDLKKTYLFLLDYELTDWLTLSSFEKLEIKRLTSQEKDLWSQEIRKELQRTKKADFIKKTFHDLLMTWILPWIHSRNKVASANELIEFFEQLSTESKYVKPVLKLLFENRLELIFEEKYQLSPELFAATTEIKINFMEVESLAKSYFVKNNQSYPLNLLKKLISAELIREWKNISNSLIDSVFYYSKAFNIYRNLKDEWIIEKVLL